MSYAKRDVERSGAICEAVPYAKLYPLGQGHNISFRTRRRDKGKGSGWIECKPIKRSGKEYKQYWYHYEEWEDGDRVTKKSKYIPKSKRSLVEKMNSEKAPVAEILKVLSNRSKLNF